jgi:hypothetical protein
MIIKHKCPKCGGCGRQRYHPAESKSINPFKTSTSDKSNNWMFRSSSCKYCGGTGYVVSLADYNRLFSIVKMITKVREELENMLIKYFQQEE